MAYRDHWVSTGDGVVNMREWVEERKVHEPFHFAGESADMSEIDEATRTFLEERGYIVKANIGRGHTRTVYRAEGGNGNARTDVTVKIPRKNVQSTSVQARIAEGKQRNWNQSEVDASNKLWHPNVAKIVDSFELPDGRTVNVEPYFEGARDLDNELRIRGGFHLGKAKETLADILEGIHYAHGRGYVHRDLKPDNILITQDGRAIVTDLQTVKHWRDIEETSLPTRGGSAFTHPDLLNAVVMGEQTGADRKSDIFSLGAIAYSMFTGDRAPFPYKLVASDDEDARRVNVNGDSMHVSISGKESTGATISPSEFSGRLRLMDRRMKKEGIPGEYRTWVLRALADEKRDAHGKIPFTQVGDMREGLKKLESSLYVRAKNKFLKEASRGIRWGLIAGIGGFLTGAGITCGTLSSDWMNENPRSLPPEPGMLQRENFREYGARALPITDRGPAVRSLVPYLEEIVEKLPALEQRPDLHISTVIGHSEVFNFMNPRLVGSWLRSCYLNEMDGVVGYNKDKDERVVPCFAPTRAYPKWFSKDEDQQSRLERSPVLGVHVLRDAIAKDREVMDVYAAYFAGEEKMRRAMIETKSPTYFPQYNEQGIMTSPGYGSYLPQYQRDLINSSLALHFISDREGHVNLDYARHIIAQFGEKKDK